MHTVDDEELSVALNGSHGDVTTAAAGAALTAEVAPTASKAAQSKLTSKRAFIAVTILRVALLHRCEE
jgi:hypothetical protein